MVSTLPRGVLLPLLALTLTIPPTLMHAQAAQAKPWLGVITQQVTPELRDGLGLPDAQGVLVNSVIDDGPADRAGLRKGDVILRYNSRSVESPSALADLVGDSREGDEVALAIVHAGERRSLNVRLGTRPADEDMSPPEPPASPHAPRAPRAPGDDDSKDKRDVRIRISRDGVTREYDGQDLDDLPDDVRKMLPDLQNMRQFRHGMPGMGKDIRVMTLGAGRGRLGVRIESLNPDLASALGTSGSEGVLVLQVMDGTPAEKAGLKAGDVIVAVDGHDVKDAEGLVGALRDVEGRVSLTVSRRGTRRTVEAQLEPAPRTLRGEGGQAWGRMGDMGNMGRLRDDRGTDRDDLRQQVDELRQQLRDLRHQLEERNHE